MQSNEIELLKAKLKTKLNSGDFILLSKVLEVKRNTAVARFNRNDKKTVLIMEEILKEKEALINKVIKYASYLHST